LAITLFSLTSINGNFKAPNDYRRISGVITKIDDSCKIIRRNNGRRITSDDMRCGAASAQVGVYPFWQEAKIRHSMKVEVRYTDPANGKIATARFRKVYTDEKLKYRLGDKYSFQAHTERPGKTRD
jgi:hypothetical protein